MHSFIHTLLNLVPDEILAIENNFEMTINLMNDGNLKGFYSTLDHCYNNERIYGTVQKQVHIIRKPFTSEWRLRDLACNCKRPPMLYEADLDGFKNKIPFQEAAIKRHNLRSVSSC
jgi:hypothetical protein